MERRIAKVLLLGEGGVGKTSLVRRFVKDEFSDDYISTIGTKVTRKDMETERGTLTLMLWDIHGQRTLTPLHRSNYKGAQGALLVFDLTRRDTFVHLDQWLDDLYSVTGKIPVVLLGNKHDIVSELPKERGELEGVLSRYPGENMSQRFRAFLERSNPELVETYVRDLGITPEFELVLRRDIDAFTNRRDLKFMLTSAKSGLNVERAFSLLGRTIGGLEDG